MLGDERLQQLGACVGVEVDDLDAARRAASRAPPWNVRDSPTTTVPIPNWRTSPLQYQHGASVVTMTVSR